MFRALDYGHFPRFYQLITRHHIRWMFQRSIHASNVEQKALLASGRQKLLDTILLAMGHELTSTYAGSSGDILMIMVEVGMERIALIEM